MKCTFNKSLKWFIPAAFCLVVVVIALKYLEFPQQIKTVTIASSARQERWDAIEKEVATWGDALGLGIDPAIKKMVIVLNLLGFKTTQSCEGHIGWGRPYPWVSITTSTPELEILNNDALNLQKLINDKEAEIQKKYPELPFGEAMCKGETPELHKLWQERVLITEKLQKYSKLKMAPLRELITTFYTKHSMHQDTILVLSGNFETFELSSLGGEWQVIRDENEKLQKLHAYQKEMNAFADYLTDHYFNA